MSNEQIIEVEQNIDNDVVSVYSGMNEVFAHTKKIIDTMKQGEKIAIRDLADKVAAQVQALDLNLPNGNIMNLVQLFCKKSKEVSVEVGRGGGVYKGGKPKRIDSRPRCPSCNQVVRDAVRAKIASTSSEAHSL